MKSQLQALLDSALQQLQQQQVIPTDWVNKSTLERTRDNSHGDWASNLAMVSAKAAGLKPRDLAQKIVDALPTNEVISKIDIAGPGFINFYLQAQAEFAVLNTIIEQQTQFGRSQYGQQQKMQVEFVSANPTSSLHVGHGRGAAYGMTVANLLEAIGYQVEREYYVNDAGRQMAILATSTFLRYLQLNGAEFKFPSNGYKGDYIFDIAKLRQDLHCKWFLRNSDLRLDTKLKNIEDRILQKYPEANNNGLLILMLLRVYLHTEKNDENYTFIMREIDKLWK